MQLVSVTTSNEYKYEIYPVKRSLDQFELREGHIYLNGSHYRGRNLFGDEITGELKSLDPNLACDYATLVRKIHYDNYKSRFLNKLVDKGDILERDILDGPMCEKFADSIIELLKKKSDNKSRIKKNNLVPASNPDQKPQYYYIIPKEAEKFISSCHENMRIYIGISVGQNYHKEKDAEAQILCLHRLRESCEQVLNNNVESGVKVRIDWPVEIIIADSLQVFNSISETALDLDNLEQCIQMIQINNDKSTVSKVGLIEEGKAIEKHYRKLLRHESQDHQQNVVINLTAVNGTYRWSDLETNYTKNSFVKAVNYLENCFKFGVERRGLDVSGITVNGLAYAFCELVLNSMIFDDIKFNAKQSEKKFIFYPGPLNFLNCGSELLKHRFEKYNKENPTPSDLTTRIKEDTAENIKYMIFTSDHDDKYKKKRREFVFNSINRDFISRINIKSTRENDKIFCPTKSQTTRLRSSAHMPGPLAHKSIILTDLEKMAFLLLQAEEDNDEKLFQMYEKRVDCNARMLASTFQELIMSDSTIKYSAEKFEFLRRQAKKELLEKYESLFFEKFYEDDCESLKKIFLEIDYSENYVSQQTECIKRAGQKDSNGISFYQYFVRRLIWDIHHTESNECLLLVAARLESLGLCNLSETIYIILFKNGFEPLAQLVNLKRTSMSEEDMSEEDKFIQRLDRIIIASELQCIMLRRILDKLANNGEHKGVNSNLSTLSSGVESINMSEPDRCALIRHYIACHIEQDDASKDNAFAEATLFISDCLMSKSIEFSADYRVSVNVCSMLEHLYRQSGDPETKASVINRLSSYTEKCPDDMWVQATSAYLKVLNASVTILEENEKITTLIRIGELIDRYKFNPMYESVTEYFREKLYYLTVHLLCNVRDTNNSDRCEAIIKELLEKSAKLKYLPAVTTMEMIPNPDNSKNEPPVIEEQRPESLLSEEESAESVVNSDEGIPSYEDEIEPLFYFGPRILEVIISRYENDLEEAMRNLNEKFFSETLDSFKNFIRTSLNELSNKFTIDIEPGIRKYLYQKSPMSAFEKYEKRLSELDLNKKCISTYKWLCKNRQFFSIENSSNQNSLERQFNGLTKKSPLRISLLWNISHANKEEYCLKLAEKLKSRFSLVGPEAAYPNGNIMKDTYENIVRFMADHCILAKQQGFDCARVLFECLRYGGNMHAVHDIRDADKLTIIILADIFLDLIEINNPMLLNESLCQKLSDSLACSKSLRVIKNCWIALDAIKETGLMVNDTYDLMCIIIFEKSNEIKESGALSESEELSF